MAAEGFSISSTISIGDIATVSLLVGTIIYNYYTIVRRVDRISERVNYNEKAIEDLKRGRGLIMESWPVAMQRLMGFRNGPTP